MEKAPDYDRRIRSLRKRLALDFQPLRTTLSKGLDVLIDVRECGDFISLQHYLSCLVARSSSAYHVNS